MRRSLVVFAILASATQTLPVWANEGGVELSNKARTSASASEGMPAKNAEAPFRHARDPMPEMMMREEQERKGIRGSCDAAASALCYDMADGRIVYRQARQYMPKFDGLRAEAVSLRHDRIVLKYTFK
jgi:hypothetical protein